MERIADEGMLVVWLRQLQDGGATHGECLLTSSFAARMTDVQLRARMDLMLHRTQRRAFQLRRLRDGTLHLGLTLTLRDGIRLAWAAEHGLPLSAREHSALRIALEMLDGVNILPDEAARFRLLFDRLARHARYEDYRPGDEARASVVSACGALMDGRANCQGFADAYWLLCTLAGLTADYQPGYAGGGTHLWNVIRIGDVWYAADVSRASRLLRTEGQAATARTFCMDVQACSDLGLRWDPVLATHDISVVGD